MSHHPQRSFSRRDFLALTAASVAASLASMQTAGAQTQLPTGELTGLTLKQASDLIKAKKVSSLELTKACLARIDQYEPKLNAFITVTAEKALDQAREADAEIAAGDGRGALLEIKLNDRAGSPLIMSKLRSMCPMARLR